jgi:hypothetical protein
MGYVCGCLFTIQFISIQVYFECMVSRFYFVLVLALVLIGGAASWSAAVGGGAQGELNSGGGRCGGVEGCVGG